MEKFTNISTIIWDWNGTLLDDVDICIGCMNTMLKERQLPLLDHERYLEIFTFPVKEYYLKAGFDFDKEPFELPAHEFIDRYREDVFHAPLHIEVVNILGYLKSKGYRQTILSAMEKEFLLETMSGKGITGFFDAIYGIENHLGAGKTIAALRLIEEQKIQPAEALMIGDTLHDAEIARELDLQCILVSDGHQSYDRLLASGFPVIHRLDELRQRL